MLKERMLARETVEYHLPTAVTAALAATVKVSGFRSIDGHATALLPRADRLHETTELNGLLSLIREGCNNNGEGTYRNLTWSISFSAISVA